MRARPKLSTQECRVIAHELKRHPKVKDVVQRYAFGNEYPVVVVRVRGGTSYSVATHEEYLELVKTLAAP